MVEVEGLDDVLKNLNGAIEEIDGNVEKGIKAAGFFIKGESQARTPVDQGILRNSAFVKSGNSPEGPFATVGYTAFYAPYVHEAPMKLKGKLRPETRKTGDRSGKSFFWDGGENKFLEKAAMENFASIINIITRFAGKSNGSK